LSERKIIDAFLFDSELTLLEHRFAETFDLVDIYIIIEAGETFQGKAKPLTFSIHRDRFNKYASKIRLVALPRLGDAGATPWERERVQRDAALYALRDANVNDILLLLDADEIPSRPVLLRLRAEGLAGSRRLMMTRHYEAVDMLGPRSPCCPAADDPFPFALRRLRPPCWNTLGYEWHSKSGVALSMSAVIGKDPINWKSPFTLRRAAPFDGALTNAGRHLCFVDPSCLPERKLGRVAHAEFATERSQWTVHLARCRRYAIHHRGWWYAERPVGKLPEDLSRLIQNYPDIRTNAKLPWFILRRVVRAWASLRCWQGLSDSFVQFIDRHFKLLTPVAIPLLLIMEIVRATSAWQKILRAPNDPSEPRHFG